MSDATGTILCVVGLLVFAGAWGWWWTIGRDWLERR